MAILNLNSVLEQARNSPADRGLCVRKLETNSDERWDRFVMEHPDGTFFQLLGWKRVISDTFGFEPQYFYAERGGDITGIVPLFLVRNWIIGRALISTPFAVYGGICAKDKESEETLLEHVKELASSKRVDYLELRNRNKQPVQGFHPNRLYVTFTSELSADPEVNFKLLPRDARYMIRKASRFGLSARYGTEQLGDFYRLFALSMRRHGTPTLPLRLFDNFLREFQDQVRLLMIYEGSQPIAGVISFLFRDTILPYYAGTDDRANQVAGNNFMYWELMKTASKEGIRHFDFGRSKRGTGSFAFKTGWNMKLIPLDYQVLLVERSTAPNFSPVNSNFRPAIGLWKRLPLPVTTWIGPQIVRWFP